MDEKNFLQPHFTGKRFDNHELPLEILKDFSALNEIIVKIAAKKFLEKNPDRKRLPKGFREQNWLTLSALQDGSVEVSINLQSATPSLFPNEYFLEARDVFLDTISKVGSDKSLDGSITPDIMGLCAILGQHLHEDEQFTLANRQIVYSIQTQKSFRREADRNYEKTIDIYGRIFEYDKLNSTAKIQTYSGERYSFAVSEDNKEIVSEAFLKYPDTKVELLGTLHVDVHDNAKDRLVIESLDIVDPMDTSSRIEEFRNLKEGWLNEGYGKTFCEEDLNWLDGFMANQICMNVKPPYLYPIEGENISAEWDVDSFEIILEIELSRKTAHLYYYGRKSNDEGYEADYQLSQNDDCQKLIQFLKEKVR